MCPENGMVFSASDDVTARTLCSGLSSWTLYGLTSLFTASTSILEENKITNVSNFSSSILRVLFVCLLLFFQIQIQIQNSKFKFKIQIQNLNSKFKFPIQIQIQNNNFVCLLFCVCF